MNEFEFLVKIEGYKEKTLASSGDSLEDAKFALESELNISGFMDIQYIIPC